jgi:hypothetical protein
VEAIDASYAPLPLDNNIILFLKFIPETGAYRITEATGSFDLENSSFRPLTERAFPPGVIRDKDSFLQTLRVVTKEQ